MIAGADGGDMKHTLMLFAIVSGALLTTAHAATPAEFRPATVVSVESRLSHSPTPAATLPMPRFSRKYFLITSAYS